MSLSATDCSSPVCSPLASFDDPKRASKPTPHASFSLTVLAVQSDKWFSHALQQLGLLAQLLLDPPLRLLEVGESPLIVRGTDLRGLAVQFLDLEREQVHLARDAVHLRQMVE